MKTISFFILFIFSTLSFAGQQEITFATSADFPPFNAQGENCGELPQFGDNNVCGFEVEITMSVCAALNWNCNFVVEPFDFQADAQPGILQKLIDNKAHYDAAIAFMSATEERLEVLNTSKTYYEGQRSLYINKHYDVATLMYNDKGFPIPTNGSFVVLGSGNYTTQIESFYSEKELNNIQIVQVDSTPDQVKLLDELNADFVFGPDAQSSVFTSAGHTVGNTFLSEPSLQLGARVFSTLTSQGQEITNLYTQGLALIKENGEYDRISESYSFNNWGCFNGPEVEAPECN